jgi:hypothetical protein
LFGDFTTFAVRTNSRVSLRYTLNGNAAIVPEINATARYQAVKPYTFDSVASTAAVSGIDQTDDDMTPFEKNTSERFASDLAIVIAAARQHHEPTLERSATRQTTTARRPNRTLLPPRRQLTLRQATQ